MKVFLKILKWLFAAILVVFVGLYVTGNQFLIKGVWAVYLHGNKTATIDDARFFDTRTVEISDGQPWPISPGYNKFELTPRLQQSLVHSQSVAFLMVQKGKLVYEQYWDGYSDSSRSNSFSMAKSITTMLAQCAIQEGLIKSWDQKVIDFLPELKGEFAAELTLRNLSTMTAGLKYNEHYTNPFDITAKSYYGPDIWNLMLDEVPVINQPGSFEYQSGATQLLGMIVSKATGKHLADYASEKLWKPLGAEHAARWHLDSKGGNEIAFCCFNSNARDFARFGQLMIQNGNWKGQQLLDSSFVQMATQSFAVPYYGHSFWIDDSHGPHIYYQRGILGQYIIVIPEYNLVIVRLGKARGKNIDNHPEDFRVIVEEILMQFQ